MPRVIVGEIAITTAVFGVLFSFYCLYRLWRYGPYNAELRFQLFHFILRFAVPIFGGVGTVLVMELDFSLSMSLVWTAGLILLWFISFIILSAIAAHICNLIFRKSERAAEERLSKMSPAERKALHEKQRVAVHSGAPQAEES